MQDHLPSGLLPFVQMVCLHFTRALDSLALHSQGDNHKEKQVQKKQTSMAHAHSFLKSTTTTHYGSLTSVTVIDQNQRSRSSDELFKNPEGYCDSKDV